MSIMDYTVTVVFDRVLCVLDITSVENVMTMTMTKTLSSQCHRCIKFCDNGIVMTLWAFSCMALRVGVVVGDDRPSGGFALHASWFCSRNLAHVPGGRAQEECE